MSKVIRIAAARRLVARRRTRSLQAEARRLIEAHGPHVGYTFVLAARVPELPDVDRQRWTALADAIEREVGFGWYLPEEAGRA